MPIRKPPCKKECQMRTQDCHTKCEAYSKYAQLLKKDKDAKQEYKAIHSAWTLAKSQSFKRSEKYRQKKSKGEVK